jgi:hypothetical protein
MVYFYTIVLDNIVHYKRSNTMMAKKIKALIMTEQGGPEVLRIAEVDKPEIKKDTDRVVTFDGVGEAHPALEAGETLGGVVLKIEQE